MAKSGFHYSSKVLCADGVPLNDIAQQHGTPTYVYSAGLLRDNYRRIAKAFAGLDAMIAYSVKSNSNLSVLKLLAAEGAAFDIVSGGELDRVRRVGISGDRVIFAGVGKSEQEIRAGIRARVSEFNVESEVEAERIQAIAASMKRTVPIALRINPNVDAKTHKYITTGKTENKFGISLNRALALAKRMVAEMPNLRLEGLHCHVGSQILDPEVHPRVVEVVLEFAKNLMKETGVALRTLNMGGGFGIAYSQDQKPLDPTPFAKAIKPAVKELGVKLILEPGRSISGPAGVLLTRVEYVKKGDSRTFAILDGSMTELLRPTLYEAHHDILSVEKKKRPSGRVDFVGPVCESGDFLALDRESEIPEQGELLAVMDAGAYGFVMASHYNSRPNVAEILVDNGTAKVVRTREKYGDLVRNELSAL